MHPFRRLLIADKARAAAIALYELTRAFHADEQYGIVAQLRRAAVSVGANIAEGSKRQSKRDFAHFVNIAEASAGEIRYVLDLAIGLGHVEAVSANQVIAMYEEIERMLCGLRKRLLGE